MLGGQQTHGGHPGYAHEHAGTASAAHLARHTRARRLRHRRSRLARGKISWVVLQWPAPIAEQPSADVTLEGVHRTKIAVVPLENLKV